MSFTNSQMSNQFKKTTSLNPNAAEFVPSFRKSTTPTGVVSDANSASKEKVTLDRTDSAKSNNSEDEARRYWQSQLPDDIIPDFSAAEKDEIETALPSLDKLTLNAIEDPFSSYPGEGTNSSYMLGSSNWDQIESDFDLGFVDGSSVDHGVAADASFDPVDYLVSQFPGFSAQSLADLYCANGYDLNITIETLIQLEIQVDSGAHPTSNLNSAAPSFTMGDFPALPTAENETILSNVNRPPLITSTGTNFASAVRKVNSSDPLHGRLENKNSTEYGASVGTSRVSQISPRQYNSTSKLAVSNKLPSGGPARAAPIWLETGDAVASMYAETREEARDYARLRNMCFDQARQAYLIGNKALAKELSVKGQLYNLQMKAAHGKAKENIYRQRNPTSSYGPGQVPFIDLHGLHVSEAIHILKQELSILKSTARATGERSHLLVCVGTGHHTKGSRTPARLPMAVEQFLLDQGFHFTQPQAGLLRVSIY
ncbi:CTC-interacting domain 7 [Rhynchospora pubera]|uniref:CTC-interacting domain 7 n=1 Tax=Rhynchospora pubera TaxID=906938 RepID=A0AAV8FH24_9POAL|nr:CTC-interacting domain 7 [Rhynchospora pubera]